MTQNTEFPQPTPVPDTDVPNWRAGQSGTEFHASGEKAFDYFDKPPEQDEIPKRRSRLGENRKTRGGPRQLTKKDIDQLHQLYGSMSLIMMPFHQRGATAVAENAESCVQAWEDLAKQNDSVRRALLGILEGGAWGILLSAHMPILYAFIPERVWDNMPMLFGMNGKPENEEATE